MTYQSIEDVGMAFYKATQDETNSLFKQGEVIYNAVQQGFKVDEVCQHCTTVIRRTKRTIYKRYAVYRTYPKPFPLPWEMHSLAADVVDYRLTDASEIAKQQAQAHVWLQKAISEQWGTTELKTAIAATHGDATTYTRTVLVNNASAVIYKPDLMVYYHVLFDDLDIDLPDGQEVLVTIVVKDTTVESEGEL